MAEEDTDWSYSYSPVPTLSSGLEKGGYEGTTLLSNSNLRTRMQEQDIRARLDTDPRLRISTERRQLNNGGFKYSTKERSYQDSGFSEDMDIQMNPVTTYLGKTKSGTIYIEPNDDTKMASHYSQPLVSHSDISTNERVTIQRGVTMKTPPTSPSSSSGHLKRSKCSWRSLAVLFIVLSLAMGATLVFLIASSSISGSQISEQLEGSESAKACPVVDSSPQLKSSSGVPEPVLPGGSPARNLPPDGASFREIKLKNKMAVLVPPFGYLNLQFFQQESLHVDFDLWVPRGSSFAVYARRNALPTHTKYNYILLVSGNNDRNTRSTGSTHSSEQLYLEEGHWFVSVYNDDGESQPVEILLADAKENNSDGCGKGCNDQGECKDGKCVCNQGFEGEFCTLSVCPVLCSGQGEYVNGECKCRPGWKGKECHIRYEDCEEPDCSGHGHCQDGICACIKGYKGEFCQEADCADPDCGGHGFCVSGQCVCKKGWVGATCAEVDPTASGCSTTCSAHGRLDLGTQMCVCEPGWTGVDCNVQECRINCGDHGTCENMECVCEKGWSGEVCQNRNCDARCLAHGQCKNGTCLCVRGWNGKHCTLEGCPNQCSGHGECRTDFSGTWSCECSKGWDGSDCSTQLETQCADAKDNDRDGLVDCQDPECCSSPDCRNHQLCYTVPKPINTIFSYKDNRLHLLLHFSRKCDL